MSNIEPLFAALAAQFPGVAVSLTHVPALTEEREPEVGGILMVQPSKGEDGGSVVVREPAPRVLIETAPARWVAAATLPNPKNAGEVVRWTGEGPSPADALAKLGGFAVAVRDKLVRAGVWDPSAALADALGRIVVD